MRIGTALLLALGLVTSVARAAIVYNSFGSNDTYSVFAPPAAALGNGYAGLATSFTPTNRVALDSITVTMAHDAGAGPVRLTVRSDNGGTPGTNVLEVVDASGFLSGTGSVRTITSTVHPVLHPGVTYWIVAQLAAPGDVYQWHGAGLPVLGRAFDLTDDGVENWSADLESSHALRVEGTVISDLDWLILLVTNSDLPGNRKHPLLVSLRAADRAFDRGQCKTGKNIINAFQNKVRAQVVRIDAELAATLTEVAQDIVDGTCETDRRGRGRGRGRH